MRILHFQNYTNNRKDQFCNLRILFNVSRKKMYLSKMCLQKPPPEEFYKKVTIKNFAIFTRQHLCWSLFFKACNFIKKETPTQVLFVNIA